MPKFSRRFAVRSVTVVLSLLLLIGLSASAGYYAGVNGHVSSQAPFYVSNAQSSDQKVDFSLFWQAWNVIDQKFYGTADNQKRLNGAIAGMVGNLGDPYTVYFPPSESQIFKTSLQGSFGGIGAELVTQNGQLTIVAPLDGTPAAQAGLKAQDIILKIDDKKASDYSFDDAVTHIRGEVGSHVVLTILRPGVQQPFTVDLVRQTITVKSVKSSQIPPSQVASAVGKPVSELGPNGSIAYIKINLFGADTLSLFQQALQDAKSSNKQGMIIDLRDNPGGQLDTVIDMIGLVIPENPKSDKSKLQQRTAVLERDKNGQETVMRSTTQPILDTLPMVVLVNGGSASASEIFSGAMKDYGRATVLGTKTFGKGSVQQLVDLDNHGSIKVTIAKWFTPLGNGIDGTGITPDITLDLPTGSQPSTDDAQVTKALQLLLK